MPLSEASARPLVWVQPMPMRPAYELWAGETVVATLRYRGLQRREALGCAAEGVWTLDADDVEAVVSLRAHDRAAGRFDVEAGVLRLTDGDAYRWRPAAGPTPAAFTTLAGAPVVLFTSELAGQARLRVDVAEEGAAHVTLLAVVGCYHLLAARTVQAPAPVMDPPLSNPQPVHRS